MEQLIPSLVFYVLVLVVCLAKPGVGRVFVGFFFLLMAIGVNVVLVLVAPEQFVALGTDEPLVPLYRWFFENVVALAPSLFGLLAAAFEVTLALMMLSRERYVKWGLIGGIVFLLAITPLGVWTLANPVMALALTVLLRQEYRRSLAQMIGGAVRRSRPRAPRAVGRRRVR